MEIQTIFDGIRQHIVVTDRGAANVLERPGGKDSPPVVFIHGNVSSSLFWQPLMLALPESVRALAIDLRGFGGSPMLPVDATRGLGDFSDDVVAVLETLGIDQAHLVGWSMGGGVAMQLMLEHPRLVSGLTLVAPVSPYGFGGTAADGRMLTSDGAGTGAGGANPDFIARLAGGDATDDEQTSPRSVYRNAYVASGFTSKHEDVWVQSMLTTATGDDNYPGTSIASENWPGFAPGTRGVLNTMAPQYFNVSGIARLADKPPVLWIRGDSDAIVSDASAFDLNFLGSLGVVPGWPGAEVAPPQQMIVQTRAVLDSYRAAGGTTTELLLENCGHSPHLEHPAEFLDALTKQLARG